MKMFSKVKLIDLLVHHFLFVFVLFTVGVTVTVVFVLGNEAVPFFLEVSLIDFLTGTKWEPLLEPKSFGVLPLVFGTFLIVIGAVLVALPIGLLTAIFMSEYASHSLRSVVKPVLEVLAGIPTVVYGYFALTFITPLLRSVIPGVDVFNAASAALVVGIMILPMISSLCDDAFRAIPRSLRDGAYALGATSYEVIWKVVIPASFTRIGAALVLAVSRAIGETMAVTLAAGATPTLSFDVFGSVQTMTAYIVQVALGDTPAGGIEYQTSYAVGALLFVITFVLNIFGNVYIFKAGRKFS